MHAVCDLNIIIKAKGLLMVTGSHVYWKSDILEMVLQMLQQ